MILLLAGITFAQQGLFSQVISKPTGQNGYEDYVRAAEMVTAPEFRKWRQLTNGETTSPPPAGLAANSTRLEQSQWVQIRYRAAFEAVRLGNAKPVSEPREALSLDTLFPEFTYFRDVTRAMAAASYAEFASGASNRGTDLLMQALVMADNVGRSGTGIGLVVGGAQSALIYSELASRAPQLSKPDCERIDRTTTELLARGNPMMGVMETERRFGSLSIQAFLEGKPIEEGGDMAKLFDGYGRLTEPQKAEFRRVALASVNGRYTAACQAFTGPESEWIAKSRVEPSVAAMPAMDDPAGMAEAVVELISPFAEGFARSAVTRRAQLRILRLYARVLAYRWEHGKLPLRLAEASSDVFDPLTNGPFGYEPTAEGFRVYSKGVAETGEIELRYRRPAPEDRSLPPVSSRAMRSSAVAEGTLASHS